jgi:flagellar L-ring protein precursor FlgH
MRHLLAAVLIVPLAACGLVRRPLPPPPPVTWDAPPPLPAANGSLWHAERAENYAFLDVRAHFPGDLLTVVVSERATGTKDATTDTSAESSVSANVQDFFGIPAGLVKFLPQGFNPESSVRATTARSSKGDGETTRTGTMTANITVTVVSVDPTGNLRVRGDKVVSVNREDQWIALTGTVRPEDIASDNSVASSRLADARIDFYGRGTVGDKQGTPLVHRLYDWIWPF